MLPHPQKCSPELLAPAGDWDAMRAAVANGADAVYFGLSQFNARHRATNFTVDELPQVMGYLHDHNVRGYVTFNTLIFSTELDQAVTFITACARAAVDALIVQDLGIAQLIHTLAPQLPVHGSTQMTLTEPRGIEFVRTLGVQRVIVARELSLRDIEKIRAGTDMPVEVFVHGALCVAYSGQCLTSESLGGRSANRGQCAQACRLPYDLMVDGAKRDLGELAYLLSPGDLAAYDLIGELTELGVCSMKIEGRLKSTHYVAATTQTYRAAIDAAVKQSPFELGTDQQQELAQSFSRGFTPGFFRGVDHQQLVQGRFPKSRGLRVGTIHKITPQGVWISTDPQAPLLKPGAGVVFDMGHPEQWEQGGRVYEVLPRGPRLYEIRFRAGDVNLSALESGALVWRTDAPDIRKKLERSYARDTVARREKLHAHVHAIAGEPLLIMLHDQAGNRAEARSGQLLESAMKHPLSMEVLREQLSRLGDTPFELGEITLNDGATSSLAMVPKSLLNELRRQAVEQLMQQRQARIRVEVSDALTPLREQLPRQASASLVTTASPNLYVLTRHLEQLQAVLDWQPRYLPKPTMVYCDFEDVRRYKQALTLCRSAGVKVALATLRVVKPGEEGLLQQIADCQPDAVIVRNLAGVSFFADPFAGALIGDFSLNIANELTAGIFQRAGVGRMVPSFDLNWTQMKAMFARIDPGLFEVVCHFHMPMFHNEHCVFAHTLSNGKDYRDCGRPCESHRVELRDRVGESHPLVADVGCRNTVYNGTAQSAAELIPDMKKLGVRHFRIELLRETAAQTLDILHRYDPVLAGHDSGRQTSRQLRVINQLGVTRGTLDYE